MFMLSAYPAPVLRWRQGPMMSGFLTFMDRYRDEAACIAALAELRWPNGFICAGWRGYQLAARPRVFECADCGRQHSVTAGTVFHRTLQPRHLKSHLASSLSSYPRCFNSLETPRDCLQSTLRWREMPPNWLAPACTCVCK